MKSRLGILVMAAGKGTRMRSELPKVLHPILDMPMLGHLLRSVLGCGAGEAAVLVGAGGERVEEYLRDFPEVRVLWQREQLGTGHAVKVARDWWGNFDTLLVLNGDLPLLRPETLRDLIDKCMCEPAACTLLSFEARNPDGYGRVVRSASGIRIVEHKDASEAERGMREVNAGCYLFDVASLARVIDRVENHNVQGEYYLPDVVSLMQEEGMSVRAVSMPAEEMRGVNTQAELAEASAALRDRIAMGWMERGVMMLDPSSVWIGPDVELSPDVRIAPNVQMWGRTRVGRGSSIGPGCILTDALLGCDVVLTANVIVEASELCDGAKAGPFAYIREGSCLEECSFAGKFVELKRTTVGRNSKVPHLTYLGDARLGKHVNIGAGTITCNYDGRNKHPTTIGDRCFVGSDTMFVAPAEMGDDASTAAGSVITDPIPDGALGVGRARQRNIEGWALRRNQLGRRGG